MFTTLTAEEQDPPLQELGPDIEQYQHLRSISLVKNELTAVHEIAKLPYILTINTSENQIANIDFFGTEKEAFQFLQIANFSTNKLTTVPEIHAPNLQTLNLNTNEITTAEAFKGHDALKLLELRKN